MATTPAGRRRPRAAARSPSASRGALPPGARARLGLRLVHPRPARGARGGRPVRRGLLPVRGGRGPLRPGPEGGVARRLHAVSGGGPPPRAQHGPHPRPGAPGVPPQPPALLPQAQRPRANRAAPPPHRRRRRAPLADRPRAGTGPAGATTRGTIGPLPRPRGLDVRFVVAAKPGVMLLSPGDLGLVLLWSGLCREISMRGCPPHLPAGERTDPSSERHEDRDRRPQVEGLRHRDVRPQPRPSPRPPRSLDDLLPAL